MIFYLNIISSMHVSIEREETFKRLVLIMEKEKEVIPQD